MTVVYVTHDQREALTMSDRVAVFNDGRPRSQARRLYERPEARSSLSSSAKTTSLAGTVRQRHGGQCSVALGSGQGVVATAVGASEKVNLAIRPEKVALGAAAAGCINRFPAKVLEVSFLGDQLRVRLAALGREDFIVKFANAPGQAALEPGGTVEIGWRAEDCRALGE